MYGLSGIPYAYVFARKKSFSASYALFIILGIMLGVLLTFGVLAMEMSQDKGFMDWAHVLKVIFTIFCPPFGLTYYGVTFSQQVIKNYNFRHMGRLKLLSMCSREGSNACCKGEGPACDTERSYMNVLSPDIWYMCLGMAVYLLLNIFLDSYTRKFLTNKVMMQYKTLRNGKDKTSDHDASGFDEDDGPNTNTLRVRKLKKSYSGRQVVNNVSLNLKKGECMGILGVNGAGKTTTFRMLTREEVKDNGEIKINDVNVDSEEVSKTKVKCCFVYVLLIYLILFYYTFLLNDHRLVYIIYRPPFTFLVLKKDGLLSTKRRSKLLSNRPGHFKDRLDVTWNQRPYSG